MADGTEEVFEKRNGRNPIIRCRNFVPLDLQRFNNHLTHIRFVFNYQNAGHCSAPSLLSVVEHF
jgi:hypothetical protein